MQNNCFAKMETLQKFVSAVCLHFGTFCKQNVRKMFSKLQHLLLNIFASNTFLHQQICIPPVGTGIKPCVQSTIAVGHDVYIIDVTFCYALYFATQNALATSSVKQVIYLLTKCKRFHLFDLITTLYRITVFCFTFVHFLNKM